MRYRFGWAFWTAALAALVGSTLLAEGRAGAGVAWVSVLVGGLVLILVLWLPCLFLGQRSLALLCLVCLVGLGGTQLLYDKLDTFFQDRGAAYKLAGKDVSVAGKIQYDRTHDPEGKAAGTTLALLQWAELQFLFIPLFVGLQRVRSREKAEG